MHYNLFPLYLRYFNWLQHLFLLSTDSEKPALRACVRPDMESVIEVEGFETNDILVEKECMTFRTNVKSKEEFQRWKDLYCVKNRVCFTKYRTYTVGHRKLFRQTLKCHHSFSELLPFFSYSSLTCFLSNCSPTITSPPYSCTSYHILT